MEDQKVYYCPHLNYSISATNAKNCYSLQSLNLCKKSNCPCLVIEQSRLESLITAPSEGPLIRGGPEIEQWEKDIPPAFPHEDPASPGYNPHKKGGDNPDPRKRY